MSPDRCPSVGIPLQPEGRNGRSLRFMAAAAGTTPAVQTAMDGLPDAARSGPAPESAPVTAQPLTRPPWWARYNWILGKLPPLDARQWRVLGLVSAAAFFSQYDRALFVMALPQIQQGLGIAEAEVGTLGSIVRFGALPAVLLVASADRFGRRRLLLLTIVAYTVLTGATALAPTASTFVAFQFLAHAFTQAEFLLSLVVISEELEPEHRGWAIGAFFALQGIGTGLAAVLLPLAGSHEEGWRLLYAVGLVPLLILAYWRRNLPETRAYQERRELRAGGAAGWIADVRGLARVYPGRLLAVCSAFFLFAMGSAPADFFGPKYLQDAHGWSPGNVTTLYIAGGALAVMGSAFSGWLSDRIGRRVTIAGFGTAVVGLCMAFYAVGGPLLAPAWILLIFFSLGTEVMLAAVGTEIFPTSQRATAGGLRMLMGTLGAGLGLLLEGVLYDAFGNHWAAIRVIVALAVLAPLIAVLCLPETAGRRLEEIAPEPERPTRRRAA